MAAKPVAGAGPRPCWRSYPPRCLSWPLPKPWTPIKGTPELPGAVSPSPPSASSATAVKLLIPLDDAVHQPLELLPWTPWKLPEPHIVEERRYPRRNRSRDGCAASTSPVTVAGALPTATDTTNPSRVSTYSALAACPAESGWRFTAGDLPCAAGVSSVKIKVLEGPWWKILGASVQIDSIDLRVKFLNLVNCTKNLKKIVKMQTQYCCEPYDQEQLFYKGSFHTYV
jgi:hypothetical protein